MEFLEAGNVWLIGVRTRSSSREARFKVEIVELTRTVSKAAGEVRVWKESLEGRLGPWRTSRCSYRPRHA